MTKEKEKGCGSRGAFCGHCGGRLPPVCTCGYRQLEEENAYLVEHDKEREAGFREKTVTRTAYAKKLQAKLKELEDEMKAHAFCEGADKMGYETKLKATEAVRTTAGNVNEHFKHIEGATEDISQFGAELLMEMRTALANLDKDNLYKSPNGWGKQKEDPKP